MNRNNLLYALIGLFVGSLLTIVIATATVNSHNTSMMRLMGMHTDQSHDTMMNSSTMNNSMNMK